MKKNRKSWIIFGICCAVIIISICSFLWKRSQMLTVTDLNGTTYRTTVKDLKERIESSDEFHKTCENAKIVEDGDTYKIVAAIKGFRVTEALQDLDNKKKEIDLNSYSIEPTVTDEDIQKVLDKINGLLNWSCTYDNGMSITAPHDVISLTDDGTNYVLHTEFLADAIKPIQEAYNASEAAHAFTTHNGKKITLWEEQKGLSTPQYRIRRTYLKL